MCVCTYIHVCVSVCVKPCSHALTMLHCPSDRNSNLCKDSFSLSVSSIPFLHCFCCSPFSFSTVDSTPLPPSPCVLSDCVHLLLFLSLCHSSTLLYLRLLLSVVAFISPSLSSCIDLHFFLLHFAVPLSLCCHPSILCIHLTLFILCLVSCTPSWLDRHQKL